MTLSPVPERAPADTGFRVCVRARPALPHEHDEYAERRDAVRVDSSNEITVGGDDSIGPDFARSTTYRFDRVFAPDVGQAAVYEHCARPAVTSLFDGFNSTVMAYEKSSRRWVLAKMISPDVDVKYIVGNRGAKSHERAVELRDGTLLDDDDDDDGRCKK